MSQSRTELRNQLRMRRRALSVAQQQAASVKLSDIIRVANIVTDRQRIALYLPNDGEISPAAVIQWLWQQGKECFLPVLDPEQHNRLIFAAYNFDTPMTLNRFGIKEPVLEQAKVVAAQALDLVFMPLTGFDEQGQRIGMGGGFYDRTFEFTRSTTNPRLIGLAHECQKVRQILSSDWDIPMQGVVTDHRFYPC